ncbi:MAG: TrmH family RNA methyltransferase, partial [Acutalibacteraceae bacterium]
MLENGIIFGRNAVFELFESDIGVNSVYIAENSPIKARALALAKKKGCSLKEVKPEKLSLLSGGKNHQGIVAAVSAIEYKSIEDILALAEERGEKPFIILLDSVEDPHNLGAVIRTAECAGAHGVIIEKRHSAQVSDTVVKTSAGAALHLPVCRVANAAAAIR